MKCAGIWELKSASAQMLTAWLKWGGCVSEWVSLDEAGLKKET